MTRIVDYKDISTDLREHENDFDITIKEVSIMEGTELLNELDNMYYDMSFVSHEPMTSDVPKFIQLWGLYKLRHQDEWTRIFDSLQVIHSQSYDPRASYYENKTITPDITTESTIEYGRISDTSSSTTDGLTHGLIVQAKTNTYDGELRDSAKTSNTGTDTRAISSSGSDELSGSDTTTSTTSGTTTETRTGSRDNILVNLQTDIDFAARNNLRDLIINNFIKEFMFYNNDNKEVGIYGFYY